MTIKLIGTWKNMIKIEEKNNIKFHPNKLKSCLPGNSGYKHNLTIIKENIHMKMRKTCTYQWERKFIKMHTFECKAITIITTSKIAVQVMKNMLRKQEVLGAYREYINTIPHIEAT